MFTAAIIGRPNVGKSTLFNRLVGKKIALVDNVPGLTRDRKESIASFSDIKFKIIDTAGLEKARKDSLEDLMVKQTEKAANEADIIFFVIDGKAGVRNEDRDFAHWLRKKGKPVILLVNKCENTKKSPGIEESYSLGFGEPVAISAEHGIGFEEFYQRLIEESAGNEFEIIEEKSEDELNKPIQIAIVGKPNAGKSTLFNKILGEERAIISPIAGTTRDAVYIEREFQGRKVQLVDTAGMRKKSKREGAEILVAEDSLKALQYASVAVLVVDATEPFDRQDLNIAGHIISEGRGMIIVVNKWDMVSDKEYTEDEIRYRVRKSVSGIYEPEIIFVSAMTGMNVNKVIKASFATYDRWNEHISTGKLNRWLEKATTLNSPPLSRGKRIKLRYITQIKVRPPGFAIFSGSSIKDLPDSYLRFLTNSLCDEFGLKGVPVRISLRKSKNPYENR